MEYTHKALIAAGYTRYTPKDHGEPGFFCYQAKGLVRADRPWKVAWVGNDAMMNEWVEQKSRWDVNWPDLYKWYMDPTKKGPIEVKDWMGFTVIIKGEDPMLVEDAASVGA